MKVAIPLANGMLCMHFGHCAQFAIIDVDDKEKKIVKREDITPPPHEPGLLPKWLGEKNVNVIIAGGMGSRAQALFAQNNISVIVGSPADAPEKLVNDFLNGQLVSGTNVCDH
jgi:predicted Fe-Mo cluster-binding NifX family protein